MRKHLVGWTIAVFVLGIALVGRADTIHVGGGLKFEGVQILRMEGNQLVFNNRAGREASRDISTITQLEVANEAAFTDAESAYAAGNWEKATAGYEKAVRGTARDWVRQWASLRLFETADKSGNFPAATTAYIELLRSNPTAAAGRQPTLPDAGSTFLETAAQDIERALEGNLEDRQRAELLKFLLDIHQKRGNTEQALSAAERLSKITGDAVTPENRRLLADLKLGLAKIALEKKDHQTAFNEINANREIFLEPEQQAQALYTLAAAQHHLAGEDKQKLQDAAIAYMRVLAHFPKSPQAGPSLVATAAIAEALGEPKKALALYQQAANEYPATGAKSHVERLQNQN